MQVKAMTKLKQKGNIDEVKCALLNLLTSSFKVAIVLSMNGVLMFFFSVIF